jgi:hypothetical protein
LRPRSLILARAFFRKQSLCKNKLIYARFLFTKYVNVDICINLSCCVSKLFFLKFNFKYINKLILAFNMPGLFKAIASCYRLSTFTCYLTFSNLNSNRHSTYYCFQNLEDGLDPSGDEQKYPLTHRGSTCRSKTEKSMRMEENVFSS